jgi:hypothetical protein
MEARALHGSLLREKMTAANCGLILIIGLVIGFVLGILSEKSYPWK